MPTKAVSKPPQKTSKATRIRRSESAALTPMVVKNTKLESIPSLRKHRTIRAKDSLLQLHELTAHHSLAKAALRYLGTEVYGVQADNTFQAKARDLARFVRWFEQTNDQANIDDWRSRDTKAYLINLGRQHRAGTTINRTLATLRHFAKWVNDLPGNEFSSHGLPTRGVKEVKVDEPSCKKLSDLEIHRLFKAADTLVKTQTRADQRPRRNRAILTLLYHTGLRVSELTNLERTQYTGKHLVNVKRKGNHRTNKIYLSKDSREHLDDYLKNERPRDTTRSRPLALFLVDRSGKPMARQRVWDALYLIGSEAGKHRGVPIAVHPHRLRHTFASAYLKKTNSVAETAQILGHTSLQYVGRYTRKTDKERESTIDEMFPAS